MQCGVKSPFGGIPGFDCYLVENLEEDIRMVPIGGKGYMKEDGEEWSEMAAYAAVIYHGRCYNVEFYCRNNYIDRTPKKVRYERIYKIKAIYNFEGDNKNDFIKIVKECFIAYGNGGSVTSTCEKVIFLEEEGGEFY